jgi:hypothetical protein
VDNHEIAQILGGSRPFCPTAEIGAGAGG